MPLILVGVSHNSSIGGGTQKLCVPVTDLQFVLANLISSSHVHEVVVVSSLCRVEAYVIGDDVAVVRDLVAQEFATRSGLDVELVVDQLYVDTDSSAVRHLFRVSCGLDSVAFGADTILGAVCDAWDAGRLCGSAQRKLNLLFHQAVETGRRFARRTEHPEVTVGSVAVDAACKALGRDDLAVVVLGANSLGAAVARTAFAHAAVGAVVVADANGVRSGCVASNLGVESDDFTHLGELVAWCDLLVVAQGFDLPVVEASMLSAACAIREGLLVVVDLCPLSQVPDYVDDRFVRISLDDLGPLVVAASRVPSPYNDDVNAFIVSELQRYAEKAAAFEHAPVVAAIHKAANLLRETELARHAKVLSTMTDVQRAAVEAISRGVVAKVLHAPSVALRQSASGVHAEKILGSAAVLFALDAPDV